MQSQKHAAAACKTVSSGPHQFGLLLSCCWVSLMGSGWAYISAGLLLNWDGLQQEPDKKKETSRRKNIFTSATPELPA